MLVGILCEGGLDIEPLKVLFLRTINHSSQQPTLSEPIFKKPYIAEGQIITKLDAGTETLLNEPVPNVILLCSDLDKYPERRKSIKNWLTNNEQLCTFIPLIIEPHFEEIFFSEHTSLVKILGLSHTEPVPYPELPPKKRLNNIIKNRRESNLIEITVSREEIYTKIVEGLNLDNLYKNNSDYKKFKDLIADILNK